MRRKDKEITDPAIMKKILKSAKYVTIALSKDNEPYLVSLSHGYDEEQNCVFFHCASEGKKLKYLRSNNHVWGQAILDYGYVQGECTYSYASVHFSGRVTLLQNLGEKLAAIRCMIYSLDKNPEKLVANLKTERVGTTTFGRIDIDHMTGKKSEEITI